MIKHCFLLLVVVVFVLHVNGNDEKKDPEENENSEQNEYEVISKKEFKEEEIKFKPKKLPVSNLKVVQDNISGSKHSAFSEDQSMNRADEQTVSDIKLEAENRVLENEMKELEKSKILERKKVENTDNNDNTKTDQNENLELPKEENKIQEKESVDFKQDEIPSTDSGNGNTESEDTENDFIDSFTVEYLDIPVEPRTESFEIELPENNPETEIVDLDKQKDKLPLLKDVKEDNVRNEKEIISELNNIETQFTLTEETSKQDESLDSPPKEDVSGNSASSSDPLEKDALPTQISDEAPPPPISDETPPPPISDETHPAPLFDETNIPHTPLPNEIKTDNLGDKNAPIKSTKAKVKEQEDEEANKFYEEALALLEGEYKDRKKANKLFLAASDLNHTKSMEEIAYPLLFGDNIKRNETRSREIFQYLADRGYPVGQQGLGFMYGTGVSTNSSQAKALIYTTFAALGRETLAEIMLGNRYRSGIGVEQSCESSLLYYKKVAKKVSDQASSLSGSNAVQRVRLYDELENPGSNTGQIDQDLLQYYQYLADKGDMQAQIGLGQLYFQGGRGVDINYEKAFFYFNLAAETGNGNGLAYLGKMYLQGLQVEKDATKAFDYFTKAVESKNPIGLAGLGTIYLKGDGVKQDYDKALKYFSEAAELGWVEGQLQLGNMYYNGIGVKKDYRQAVKYFTFASQSGHVLAFYNLGLMHASGAGVMRSCRTANELFKNVAERGKWSHMFMDAYESYKKGDLKTALLKYYLLAELGYEVAQSNVAYILDKDEATFYEQNQTYARALLQWSRAADQGYAVARVKLGDYYYYGLGTKINYEAAALQYRLASDQQGSAQAMFNLGYMHEQGFGLKKDIHLAKRFYDMAAEASTDAQFPVYLALGKLIINFSLDWIKKNYRFWEHVHVEKLQLYIIQNAGPDWDIYLISVLAGLLCILLLFRRVLGHR